MPFYTGKADDGSDMKEWTGVHISPDNPNEWSAQPYPKKKRKRLDMELNPQHMILDDFIHDNKMTDIDTVRTRRREKTLTRKKNRVVEYMMHRYTLDDIYKQILNKKCDLSSVDRQFVLDHYDEDGIFLYDKELD